MSLRLKIILLSAILVFGFLNYAIYSKEQLKQHGKIMLLKLVPVDPRSLMQGDYMALRYAIEPVISKQYGAIIRVDAKGIGQFIALYTGQELSKNEMVMPYSIPNNTVHIVPNEFNFLPKEHLEYYEKAEYAMFKYNNLGHQLLIGLADKSGAEIVPPIIKGKESEANLFNWHRNKLVEDKQYEHLMKQGSIMLLPIIIIEPKGYQLPTKTKFQYNIATKVSATLIKGYVKQGQAVIAIDAQDIGYFKRLYAGKKLGENEVLISYFVLNENASFSPHDNIFIRPNAFFFQEGNAKYYEDAQYGIFKYDNKGNQVLLGLADKLRKMIVPPKER